MRFWLLIVVLLIVSPARAEPVSIDLAYDHVDITTGFTGASVSVYGIKHDRGDLAIVLEGPKREVTVRRKDSVFGAWLNRSWLIYKDVPQYYNYALAEGFSDESLEGVKLGRDALRFAMESKKYDETVQAEFLNALIDLKTEQRLYSVEPRSITFLDKGFFKTQFYIPANVPTGSYVVKAYLIRDGRVVHEVVKPLQVGQVGASAQIYKFARESSFLYALICVFIAFLAGWVSNKILRRN